MPDPQDAESVQPGAETLAKPSASEPKTKITRLRKTTAETKEPASKRRASRSANGIEAPASSVRSPRKIHSQKERAQKLLQIEKAVAGGATIRYAVGQAGISEQTYYQWKKAASPAAEGDDLKDLLALEQENKRLKKMLAERLRKENAELKNKLGLA